MAFHLIQVLYWIALSTWFGGVLFIALAAGVVFRTVRENNPILPTVLSVNLENQHGSLLAGSIVGNLLVMLSRIAMVCAAGVGLAMVGQWVIIRPRGMELLAPLVRAAMFIAAVAMVMFDRRFVWPNAWRYRQEYIDNADDPDVANPAKEQFDRYHRESVTILMIVLFLLLGIILFSGNITSARILF